MKSPPQHVRLRGHFLFFFHVYGIFFVCSCFRRQVVPSPTLAQDLGGALGSMAYADVKFVAEGRPLYAHRAVLVCQSEYFTAMFHFR